MNDTSPVSLCNQSSGTENTPSFFGCFALVIIFGGFVSAIWLLLLGEWRLLAGSILASVLAPIAIWILMMPGMILLVLAGWCERKLSRFGFAVSIFMNSVYKYGVLGGWCILVLGTFTHFADTKTIFPYLIWSIPIGLGPIAYMASKEEDGGETDLVLILLLVSYLISVVLLMVNHSSTKIVIVIFGIMLFFRIIYELKMMLKNFGTVCR